MSKVRVLVGTRKGAFILSSDGKRDKWEVNGPLFAGWELYHLKGSPVDPNRIYASQTSGWFGQVIQRSDDGGKTWHQPGTPAGETAAPVACQKAKATNLFTTRRAAPLTTHQWYDGTQHPWEFKRVWHLEPSLTEPDTVYAGVEDAAIFKSTDGGKELERASRPARAWDGAEVAAGRGRNVPSLHHSRPERSPTNLYRDLGRGGLPHDDGGKNWKPINKGLNSKYIPNPTAEIGHCVHHIAMHPKRPGVLFMQKHWDVMRSDDAGDNWTKVSGNLPTDFGFAIDVHAHEPETIYVVPIKSDGEHYVHEGKLRVYRSRSGGNEWEPLTKGLPQKDCYVNVLRDAMAVDTLDDCGIYFGTTGGQVYVSPNGGDSWKPIVHDLPAVLSVEVQTLM